MIRNLRRSGQEPDLSLMSQGENGYLVLRGVFHVSPPALGGLSIDGKLTFSNNVTDGSARLPVCGASQMACASGTESLPHPGKGSFFTAEWTVQRNAARQPWQAYQCGDSHPKKRPLREAHPNLGSIAPASASSGHAREAEANQ
jgi:hypothetical protein